MEISLLLLFVAVVIALAFDVVNGFHDAANSIATIVSTRVLKPKTAVLWAAFFNLLAMFIFLPRVADTISKIVKIEPNEVVYIYVVMSGLIGAIIWDLFTWWLGLPVSSSHALIGGISGAGLTYGGIEALRWEKLWITIAFIFIAPILGFILGFLAKLALSWIFRFWRPVQVDNLFKKGQMVSAALYSIGHGANDAQKTMGIILALMIAGGVFSQSQQLSLFDPDTLWIILSCQLAMGLGTAFGGWRIVKTMGHRITKLQPIGGFCAETGGAITLFMATLWGIPVSTTQTINGAIMGVGACNNTYSKVRWSVAAEIFWAWVLTIPAAGLLAAALFFCIDFYL